MIRTLWISAWTPALGPPMTLVTMFRRAWCLASSAEITPPEIIIWTSVWSLVICSSLPSRKR